MLMMSTSQRIVLLAAVLIALLVLEAGASWLGLQPRVPVANADAKQQPPAPTATLKSPPCDDQECSNLLTSQAASGGTPVRVKGRLPGLLSGNTIANPVTPTPTGLPRLGTDKIALTPVLALPCFNGAQLVSIQPPQPVVTARFPSQVTVNLKNTGSCAWGTDWAFKWVEKDRIGANPLAVSPTATVPSGATYGFVLTFVAPGPGTLVTRWELRAPDAYVGPLVQIVVSARASLPASLGN
jgi:hypothetical protein